MNAKEMKKEYSRLADPSQAKVLSGFFKTGQGQYGEGDIFLGIKVPVQRAAVKKYYDLPLKDLQELLDSPFHEHRLSALFILINRFEKGDDRTRADVYDMYLKNVARGRVNNWDLVDLSAPNIVGRHLLGKDHSTLYELARSSDLWKRRVAVLATFTFIRGGDFKDILRMAASLLEDRHDLVHKAVGWMLREVGKRDIEALRKFLDRYAPKMPRTMLRYAIEKMSAEERKRHMNA
jgi:3-methyladenine DNA glycosylase AlkD